MTVLILGPGHDDHATFMCAEMRRRGADSDAVLFDPAWFPGSMTIAFEPSDGGGETRWPACFWETPPDLAFRDCGETRLTLYWRYRCGSRLLQAI
jgi:hypothetical protein